MPLAIRFSVVLASISVKVKMNVPSASQNESEPRKMHSATRELLKNILTSNPIFSSM